MTKPEMLVELESATAELKRCTGGVDLKRALIVTKRIRELRLALRDDEAMVSHLQSLVAALEQPRKKRTP